MKIDVYVAVFLSRMYPLPPGVFFTYEEAHRYAVDSVVDNFDEINLDVRKQSGKKGVKYEAGYDVGSTYEALMYEIHRQKLDVPISRAHILKECKKLGMKAPITPIKLAKGMYKPGGIEQKRVARVTKVGEGRK